MPPSTSAGNGKVVQSTIFRVAEFRSRTTKRVLFLEAEWEFVDALLSFLLLPLGTIIQMLSQGVKVKSIGGISSIFESVEKLDSSFLHVDKKDLVQQAMPAALTCTFGSSRLQELEQELAAVNIFLQNPPKIEDFPSEVIISYYKCTNCSHLSRTKEARCYTCETIPGRANYFSTGPYLSKEKVQNEKVEGFVKKNIAFIVTDNLEIMPCTAVRSIDVLKKLEVSSIADLDSKEITVSITQILQLLHSALTSHSCLNDVFGKQ